MAGDMAALEAAINARRRPGLPPLALDVFFRNLGAGMRADIARAARPGHDALAALVELRRAAAATNAQRQGQGMRVEQGQGQGKAGGGALGVGAAGDAAANPINPSTASGQVLDPGQAEAARQAVLGLIQEVHAGEYRACGWDCLAAIARFYAADIELLGFDAPTPDLLT